MEEEDDDFYATGSGQTAQPAEYDGSADAAVKQEMDTAQDGDDDAEEEDSEDVRARFDSK